MDIFYGWVAVGGGIFWLSGGGRTFFMGELGGWRHILSEWECADIFYEWVVVAGGIFWLSGVRWTLRVYGGGWTHILGEWGYVDIFYGWVGVGGGIFWVVGVSGGEWG